MSDDAVGYGAAPKHSRFQCGKSGNPKGRPKGSRNFKTALAKALNERVDVKVGGKNRKISRREAAAVQLANKAAGGDIKAVTLVQALEPEAESIAGFSVEALRRPEDIIVTLSIIRRIREASLAADNPLNEEVQS